MSKSLIPILSYCIIKATSLTSIANCSETSAHAHDSGIADSTTSCISNLSINDEQKDLLFSTNSILRVIPVELREKIEKYNEVDPETRKFMESLRNTNSIRDGYAFFYAYLSMRDILESDRTLLIKENPINILKIEEKIDWDPRPNYDFNSTGTDRVIVETFRTYPQNTIFNTYKTYYWQ